MDRSKHLSRERLCVSVYVCACVCVREPACESSVSGGKCYEMKVNETGLVN